ncbi:unnamed protein product (macronuclear) [Paramecium tetraurelia]|uniref:GPR180/TMEM145 transmembrane domain-containing protein n=1 Tax=Paramecium tetraurelia TaxID=5888 RepID=A0CV23_PARTE|nr:uncharacterized protein GSPATT00010808001 [Paramecium tetraurelia]CAK74640.1 unnamed protein product [Paramecium tetraurelia]|eukprot:XP_001442037.1 hypothetical protein (macronuclear) [Paramecium tetraurelia strain d4-2]
MIQEITSISYKNLGSIQEKAHTLSELDQPNHSMNKQMILFTSDSTSSLMIIGLSIRDRWALIKREKNCHQMVIGVILNKRRQICITEIRSTLWLLQIAMESWLRLKDIQQKWKLPLQIMNLTFLVKIMEFKNYMESKLFAVFLLERIVQQKERTISLSNMSREYSQSISSLKCCFSCIIHYTVYNGVGIYFFDLLGSICNNASQLLFAFLFVALSQGWTITKQELNTVQFFPFISMIVVYQSIIMIIIKYFDGSEDKYHNFYGIGGWLLMLSKIGLTFLYSYGIHNLNKQVKQKQFIFLIALVGILYQIHYPVVVFISEVFVVSYWKNRVITMTSILVSHFCMVFCAFICTTKSTAYFQLKNQSQTII